MPALWAVHGTGLVRGEQRYYRNGGVFRHDLGLSRTHGDTGIMHELLHNSTLTLTSSSDTVLENYIGKQTTVSKAKQACIASMNAIVV